MASETDTTTASQSSVENAVEEKVKRLSEEITKQQQIISQTSQALNLCAVTVEFSGSTEAVEGERHLLVASKFTIFFLLGKCESFLQTMFFFYY